MKREFFRIYLGNSLGCDLREVGAVLVPRKTSPLPGDLLQQLNATQTQLNTTQEELTSERQARKEIEAELAKLREELARAKAQP
jgi:septal ring factor EnvC (AmiA/AmiB activator)